MQAKIYNVQISRSQVLEMLHLPDAKWTRMTELKELVWCAFPQLIPQQIARQLNEFLRTGKTHVIPRSPRCIYEDTSRAHCYRLPFLDGDMYQDKEQLLSADEIEARERELKERRIIRLKSIQAKARYDFKKKLIQRRNTIARINSNILSLL